jgi:DNA topoisomerase-1
MDHKLYLSDKGIFKKNNKFYYFKSGAVVTDTLTLDRLKKVYVPPAWKSVWYASNKNCHVQVRGVDISGKKQYILSEKWINNARYTKYKRMKCFVKDLKVFKKKIKLGKYNTSKEFLIFLLFNLLIDLHIRVGNEIYAETNGSYGLTTLRQKHFNNNQLSFLGKSNINHTLDIPEKYQVYFKHFKKTNGNGPLFFYNEKKVITSDELNTYLKEHMGNDYTCKDFRTYSANILFIKAFLKNAKNQHKSKKIILKSIDSTAEHLGHTRNISRKSYISNNLLDYCYDSFETASELSPDELLCKVWEEG